MHVCIMSQCFVIYYLSLHHLFDALGQPMSNNIFMCVCFLSWHVYTCV